ncbi:MAG: Uncharacterized protein G01um101416_24 [Microgenomates group bacterium Gr01-1014_16]|nr:MAG: Uncharacterized protein G01um101416_24 [Microgenomates group bacterium Gr01-1014_16]
MPEELLHSLEPKKFPKWLAVAGAILIALSAFAFFGIFLPGKKLIASLSQLETVANGVSDQVKNQDLPGTKSQLEQVKVQLDKVKRDFSAFSWLGFIPFANNYYRDGNHVFVAADELLTAGNLTIDAIAPYADVIGLKGLTGTGDGAKTAEDRINFIINTLDKIKPQLSQIGSRLDTARKEIDQVNPNRYPQKIRPKLVSAISLLNQAALLVNDAQPLLESAPFMLGIDSARKYLVLFQNDAELRPTGGFITAYAIIQVEKGKISLIQSNDIYTLDEKFPKKIPAPEPIKKYLPKVAYWNLRDQNLSPDFKVSMDTFHPNYLLTKSPKIDGIIAVDTQLLVDLLKVTGPIGVPGFGNYSAEIDKRCNCPQVFYELEKFADQEGPVVWDSISGNIVFAPRNYGNRKSFIGPMMHSVLANVMAQPKARMGDLFNTVFSSINAKHVQFYFIDPEVQQAAESFNLAGRVRDFSGDYLMIIDTNFAGAKTNAWVTYTADQKIEVSGDGKVTKTLTLTYKNPQQYFSEKGTNLKLNGIFRDWLRIYVPKGSKLLESKGFETGDKTSEDLGKTVFEGFFTLTPQNVKTITLKYELPDKIKSPYKILIQKQAGSKPFPYNIKVNGRSHPELLLSSDKELSLPY